MSAIRIRDRNGQVKEVPYLKGDPGDTPQVDQELSDSSTNAIANKVVTAETTRLFNIISGSTYEINEEIIAIGQRLDNVEMTASSAITGASEAHVRLDAVEEQIGDISAALDGIIAIQKSLIGGASV